MAEDEGEQSLRSFAFAIAKARTKFDKQILLETHRPQQPKKHTKTGVLFGWRSVLNLIRIFQIKV